MVHVPPRYSIQKNLKLSLQAYAGNQNHGSWFPTIPRHNQEPISLSHHHQLRLGKLMCCLKPCPCTCWLLLSECQVPSPPQEISASTKCIMADSQDLKKAWFLHTIVFGFCQDIFIVQNTWPCFLKLCQVTS